MSENSFLLKEAEKVARKMIETDKQILPIESWGTGDILFVSRVKDLIYFTQVIYLDKQEFFIGTRFKDEKKI